MIASQSDQADGVGITCAGCFVGCNQVTVKRCSAFPIPHVHFRCPKCRHDYCKVELENEASRRAVTT